MQTPTRLTHRVSKQLRRPATRRPCCLGPSCASCTRRHPRCDYALLAAILSSLLQTADEAEYRSGLLLNRPVQCVWYVSMSGALSDDTDPTKTFVRFEIALESVSGDENVAVLSHAPEYSSAATVTPRPTHTAGPPETPTPLPTPRATSVP